MIGSTFVPAYQIREVRREATERKLTYRAGRRARSTTGTVQIRLSVSASGLQEHAKHLFGQGTAKWVGLYVGLNHNQSVGVRHPTRKTVVGRVSVANVLTLAHIEPAISESTGARNDVDAGPTSERS
jgi:hypothetical protein